MSSEGAGSTADVRLAAIERARGTALDPHLRPFFVAWLDTFVYHGRLDGRLRELTILRVMWRCGQPYEWGNHYRLGRAAGLTDEEILSIRTPSPARDFSGPVAVVVRAADDIVDVGHLTGSTMAAVRALFPEPGLLEEFLYLVAGYRMFAAVSASRGEHHEGPLWPPDGVGPSVS